VACLGCALYYHSAQLSCIHIYLVGFKAQDGLTRWQPHSGQPLVASTRDFAKSSTELPERALEFARNSLLLLGLAIQLENG